MIQLMKMVKSGDFARRRKESFYWYKKVIETNGEDLK